MISIKMESEVNKLKKSIQMKRNVINVIAPIFLVTTVAASNCWILSSTVEQNCGQAQDPAYFTHSGTLINTSCDEDTTEPAVVSASGNGHNKIVGIHCRCKCSYFHLGIEYTDVLCYVYDGPVGSSPLKYEKLSTNTCQGT